ncbi:MAG TPA: prepilin-type N-terminal cleavage/methylation domain-containing protein [Candidatus Deferrimicrobium sp.]|nr:prepilin-type N-terminal cleavage/methylation domain-containing protein [Candidatus Deferrimicrobium sp.]
MLVRLHRFEEGFTLIELMIVVVIIGILAALAIPRYMQTSGKARQSECKQILKQIYVMQHAYRQANSFYGDNGITSVAGVSFVFPGIGVEIPVNAMYSYSVLAAPNTFTATATANIDGDLTIDTWTITDAGVLLNTINDVNT